MYAPLLIISLFQAVNISDADSVSHMLPIFQKKGRVNPSFDISDEKNADLVLSLLSSFFFFFFFLVQATLVISTPDNSILSLISK